MAHTYIIYIKQAERAHPRHRITSWFRVDMCPYHAVWKNGNSRGHKLAPGDTYSNTYAHRTNETENERRFLMESKNEQILLIRLKI